MKILRLNLGNTYLEGMTPENIYDIGKESWKISKNIDKTIKLVLFTHRGKIIGKCLIDEWYEDADRMTFKGIMIDLINDTYLGKLNGNPIKYEDVEIEQ